MNHKYLKEINEQFNASEESQDLFEKIVDTPTERRDEILKDISFLAEKSGFAYALIALYRQQVKSGFVLADPLSRGEKEFKSFFDSNTGITFLMQWNPDRELRKNHGLLIERGVISDQVDASQLINKNKDGKACYLCERNIHLQNPGEILIDINLAGETYFAGANFAYITNNHFTIMSYEHRPQKYHKRVLQSLCDFIDKTDGSFRGIFNGLAGASIKEHEHTQVTTEEFPIEKINLSKEDIIFEKSDLKILSPKYYLPLSLIEGKDKTGVIDAADKIINEWQSLDENHTVNIIAVRQENLYRLFVILRDKRKLTGEGKSGAMASFEAGGSVVLSSEPKSKGSDEINERETFDNANLETIKKMLGDISPDRQLDLNGIF